MICKNCGTNNGDNATFCAYCGSPLTSKNRPKNKKSPNRKNNNNYSNNYNSDFANR